MTVCEQVQTLAIEGRPLTPELRAHAESCADCRFALLRGLIATGGALLGATSRYEVRGVLGEGAQGVTYDAIDTSGRAVAIKRFDVRGAQSWKDVELAEREVRVLATLDHPLVPRYIEHFEESGVLYLVMEKIEGETLEAIRRREGALPEAEVRRFLACADRALTYLHGRASPIVHRDVKPRNVVRRADGAYVLVDFGAVSELMARRGASTIVGTVGYMAPEQIQGRALPATDVFGVGATALAALTGVEPETLPHEGLRLDVRAALRGRASDSLVSSLERMLEPDPDRRAQSLALALDTLHSTPPLPPPHPPPQPAPHRFDQASEDALVKSVRKLLWVLWGLGWVIVPILFSELGVRGGLIPAVMFLSLAALLVVGWHRGALIRAALRAVGRRGAREEAAPAASGRQRVEIGPDRKVRVRSTGVSALRPEEIVGGTVQQTSEPPASRARRRG